ncbi:chitin binding peritrophin-A domain-containing protein [Chondromyces crocatus]|nr:chitin binding peritrophin-A domain-containing protein [Chondromyces crocatus]
MIAACLGAGCTVDRAPIEDDLVDEETTTEEATEALLCSAIPPLCAPILSEGQNGFSPNLCNCRFYYECVEGTATLRLCPNKTHFSPVRKQCESPDTAGCFTLPL